MSATINAIGLIVLIAALCLPFLLLGCFAWGAREVRRQCDWLNGDDPAAIAAQMEPGESYDPARREFRPPDGRPPRKRLTWEAR